jgi:hypothetical protein
MTVFDAEINLTIEEERCARYGWKIRYPPTRRRIFRGSLVADDSWHALAIVAMEGFGVYHHVAFVESNRTQTYVPRGWRFSEGSSELRLLQHVGVHGPDTNVTMDYFIDETLKNERLQWCFEHSQRELILQRWRREGMTVEDIGVVADADESFTRDFLRAAQICDVPELRPGQSCRDVKIIAASAVFEGSPKCLTEGRKWYHPDMIIGECIELIGDEKKHPSVPYEKRNEYARRNKGYNPHDAELRSAKSFPSWNAADFRMTEPGSMKFAPNKGYTGFHVHNFFMREDFLRFKYETYGHAIRAKAHHQDFEILTEDVNMMSKCVRNESDRGDKSRRREGDFWEAEKLTLPLAFQYPEYREGRHSETLHLVKQMRSNSA